MLVSICLPTYNGRQFVEAAIASVVAQTYQQYELIISDDCSDDGTYEIVQQIAQDNNKIICWRNAERLGLFGNYNNCLARAGGDLIKPFAQDDLFEAVAIERMVRAFENEPGVVLVCAQKAAASTYAAGEGDQVEEPLPPGRIGGKEALLRCLKSYRNLIGEPVSVLFDARYKNLAFDPAYCSLGDLDYWLRLLAHGDLFHICEPLVTFREHQGSVTSTLLKNMDWVLDFYRLSRQYEAELETLGVSREQYCMRFTELSGALIDQMVRSGKLQVSELDGFREVAYYSMRRCAELAWKSREYDAVINSTSWRITEPLRYLMRQLGGS
jgi:glycosyltransferase involved in cell wall biosynthesis